MTAGLLACGSMPCSAFPVSQWLVGGGSPLTVAGAAAESHRVPSWSPVGTTVTRRDVTNDVQGLQQIWLAEKGE